MEAEHEPATDDQIVYQMCAVNCGAHCLLKLHVKEGKLDWVESDDERTSLNTPQMRACLRGRALRAWLEAPERLNAPLKRTGPRGSGHFVEVSWNYALDYIASELERILAAYGNESVLVPYGTGLWPGEGSPFERLMNCLGGYLRTQGDYSSAQLQASTRYLYGDNGYYTASTFSEAANADLVVLFGNNPAGTRMGGASAAWEFTQARERGSFKVVSIDPVHTDTAAGSADEWIAIRPGTDAAFVAGCAHVLITENMIDQQFLDTYCVGYDRSTLPASAPANGSYKDYVLGTGPDATAKTPLWASRICGAPEASIRLFARELGRAKTVFVAQGWGPQRHDSGELSARAIPLLALLTGNLGLPGTNSGVRERFVPFVVPDPPTGSNPVAASIPVFEWSRAIVNDPPLTWRNAGVQGAEELRVPVKAILNHAGNCLTNQHADINKTHDLLADDTKCELVVACDIHLTDSARHADIVLPDVARVEQDNLLSSGSADITRALVAGSAWGAWGARRRPATWVCAQLADRLGVGAEYRALEQRASDGARLALARGAERSTHDRSSRRAIREDAARGSDAPDGSADPSNLIATERSVRCATLGTKTPAHPSSAQHAIRETPCPQAADALPSLDNLRATGVWRSSWTGSHIAYEQFRADPKGHPLPTPSGKIEIYSERLAQLSRELEFDDDQTIDPLPIFAPTRNEWGSPDQERFPFQLLGIHGKQRTHSSFANVDELSQAFPHELMMNPVDAARLGVRMREAVLVSNQRGALVARVRVTPRIMPGVLALPEGAWHEADMDGDRIDWGGCVNTLTSDRPTPLARGNAQHSVLVRVDALGRNCEEAPKRGPNNAPVRSDTVVACNRPQERTAVAADFAGARASQPQTSSNNDARESAAASRPAGRRL